MPGPRGCPVCQTGGGSRDKPGAHAVSTVSGWNKTVGDSQGLPVEIRSAELGCEQIIDKTPLLGTPPAARTNGAEWTCWNVLKFKILAGVFLLCPGDKLPSLTCFEDV